MARRPATRRRKRLVFWAAVLLGLLLLALVGLVLRAPRESPRRHAARTRARSSVIVLTSLVGVLLSVLYPDTDADDRWGFWRLWGPALGGAVLVTLGTVVLLVGLWSARSVPRWVPVVAAVSIVARFFVAGTAVVAELAIDVAVAVSSVAIGWHAWRSSQSPSA